MRHRIDCIKLVRDYRKMVFCCCCCLFSKRIWTSQVYRRLIGYMRVEFLKRILWHSTEDGANETETPYGLELTQAKMHRVP